MNIAGIGGGMPQINPAQIAGQRDRMIDTVADRLGIGADDLKAQLRDGASLAQIAESKGVSRAELTSAISANAPAGITPPTGMLDKLIDSKGLQPPSLDAMKAGFAQGLGAGVDVNDLLARLMQGEDRDQVAGSSGVDATRFTELLQKSFSFNTLA